MNAKKPNASSRPAGLRDKKMAQPLTESPNLDPVRRRPSPSAKKKGSARVAGSVAAAKKPVPISAAEAAWRQELGDLLNEDEVRHRLRVADRRTVTARSRRGELLALDTKDGRRLYPAFQFRDDGQPFPILTKVLAAFRGAAESLFTVAAWLVSPNSLLEQKSPAAWMRHEGDAALLLEAARRTAARLAR